MIAIHEIVDHAIMVVTPEEDLKIGRGEEIFSKALQDSFKEGYCYLFDFNKTQFIDSSCLGVLVGFYRKVNKVDSHVALCCLDQELKAIMNLTQLSRLFKIFATKDQAITYLKSLNGHGSPN